MSLFVSWSSLRTHEECKQKGYLMRSGSRNKLDNGRNFFPGTVTDRVVRDWLENDPYSNPGAMPGMVEFVVEREKALIDDAGEVMRWRDRADKADVINACVEAVKKIEPALVKHVLPFDYQAGFRFKAPFQAPHPDGGMETVLLNGEMDIIVWDPATETWRVWDVKHTRDDYYYKKTQGQLSVYDLAVLIMFGKPTSEVGLLQPLCKEQVKPVPITDAIRSDLMARVLRMANEVWSEDREPRKDTKDCKFCVVRHACSKFKPVRTDDGKRRLSI